MQVARGPPDPPSSPPVQASLSQHLLFSVKNILKSAVGMKRTDVCIDTLGSVGGYQHSGPFPSLASSLCLQTPLMTLNSPVHTCMLRPHPSLVAPHALLSSPTAPSWVPLFWPHPCGVLFPCSVALECSAIPPPREGRGWTHPQEDGSSPSAAPASPVLWYFLSELATVPRTRARSPWHWADPKIGYSTLP